MHTMLINHAHTHMHTHKKIFKEKQNIAELYRIKTMRNRHHHHLLATMPKVDNELKNIISYRIIIRYVGHKTTDFNNRCLLTAE